MSWTHTWNSIIVTLELAGSGTENSQEHCSEVTVHSFLLPRSMQCLFWGLDRSFVSDSLSCPTAMQLVSCQHPWHPEFPYSLFQLFGVVCQPPQNLAEYNNNLLLSLMGPLWGSPYRSSQPRVEAKFIWRLFCLPVWYLVWDGWYSLRLASISGSVPMASACGKVGLPRSMVVLE